MEEETTSTSTETGDEVNKGSDLKEISRKDGRTILDHYGPEYLKPEQLLEALISPGYKGKTPAEVAANLLQTFGDLKDVVTASIHQLTKVKGIGFVKACQIKAAFELSKRAASYCEEEHPVIASIDDVFKVFYFLCSKSFKDRSETCSWLKGVACLINQLKKEDCNEI